VLWLICNEFGPSWGGKKAWKTRVVCEPAYVGIDADRRATPRRNGKLLRALDCVGRDACYFTLGATRDSADATAALPFSRKGREPHRARDVLWIIEVSEASEITA
jgi:hypothetical protein